MDYNIYQNPPSIENTEQKISIDQQLTCPMRLSPHGKYRCYVKKVQISHVYCNTTVPLARIDIGSIRIDPEIGTDRWSVSTRPTGIRTDF